MKTKVTFIAAIILFASFTSMAAVLTVSNNPLGGAQYSSLDAAYNAAANSDTLIIEGTDYVYFLAGYPAKMWDKQLTVIGSGFNTNKQNFKRTMFRNSDYHWVFPFNSGGSGSSFHGIVFVNPVMFEQNVNNLQFENCLFQNIFNLNNKLVNDLEFRNCVFDQNNDANIALSQNYSTTVSIYNCIFDGYIEGYNSFINVLIIDHCLFLSPSTAHFSSVNYASISNSIFMNLYPAGTTNCTYVNNICRVAGTLPPSGNSGSGNLSNTDPLLASYTFGSLYSTAHDYDIQAGSPCELAGSDGTDIGVHGGASNFSEQGEPLIAPVVRSVIITTPVVSANGTLSVDVTASKPAED